MARPAAFLALALTVAGFAGCGCPRCPVDSEDGVGVTYVSNLAPFERGAVASVAQLLAVAAGPDSPEIRALDAGLSGRLLIVGYLQTTPDSRVRGYVLLKDGRIALDDSFLRAAPLDAAYLADARTWPFVPVLFAAGHRLAHGGSWRESVEAARGLAGVLAEKVEKGEASLALPARMDPAGLAQALRYWKANF